MEDLELAHSLADSADEITSSAFAAKGFAVRYKDDGTPVTDVDVAVEDALTTQLADVRPVRLDEPWSVMPSPARLEGWRKRAAQQSVESFGATEVTGYDPLLVAAGDLDGTLVLLGGPWDHAPFVVLVEEAGGRFSDLWGGRRLDTRTAIYSNGFRHDELLSLVAPLAPSLPTGHYGNP